MTEMMTTSATGGMKGVKPSRIGSLDPLALLALGEVSGFGADKYEAFNFLRGYDWSKSYDAAQRHLNAHWGGETYDPESGLLHVLHAAWHCLAQASFIIRGVGNDDRPAPPQTERESVRALRGVTHSEPAEHPEQDPSVMTWGDLIPRLW